MYSRRGPSNVEEGAVAGAAMTTAFTLRDARPKDHAALVEFNRRMAKETEDKDLDVVVLGKGVQRLFDDAACGRYFVAVDKDDEVVGQIMITTEWSDWRNGHFYWIQSVYVDPGWRRQGVYKALHQHVVDHARARGDVVGVRLYVEPHNARAQKTYESLGMTKTYDVMEQSL